MGMTVSTNDPFLDNSICNPRRRWRPSYLFDFSPAVDCSLVKAAFLRGPR